MKKIKANIVLIISIIMMLTLLIPNTSNAAGINITASKTTASAGETITISISSNYIGRVNLTVSNGTLSSNRVWIEGVAQTVNVTVGNQGTTTVTATPENGKMSNSQGKDENVATASVNIAISSGNSNNTTTKSNNANLGNLGITPNDFSGFRAAKTNYDVTVPNNVSTIKIYANKGHSGQTISGTGNKTLTVGKNTFNVVVTAEDGTTKKTYTLNITREGENNTTPDTTTKSNNANLKNLGIRPNDFSGFKANKTEYAVEVPNEVDTIEVYAIKGQDGQTISGTGNKTLTEGENAFNVTVTAEDGTTKKIYTINVLRKAKEGTNNPDKTDENTNNDDNTDNKDDNTASTDNNDDQPTEIFGLSELNVAGFDLKPEFKTDIYEYSLDIKENKEKLDITTVSTEANANISITGNEDLKEGENIITVLVTNEKGDKTATYQIIVNIKSEDNILLGDNESTGLNKKQQMLILGIAIIIIVGAGIGAIILIVKKSKGSASKIPYSDLYGNDEEDYETQNYNNFEQDHNINDFEADQKYNDFEEEQNTTFENETDYGFNEDKKNRHRKGKRFK